MKSSVVEFLTAFEALGYRRTFEYEVFGKDDRWYIFDGSTSNVTHVAYLEYRPKLCGYAPRFGLFNADAQARAVAALPVIFPYLPPSFRIGIWPLDRRPCWTVFDAGSQLDWRGMCVPEQRAPENWPLRLGEMIDKILKPTFWPINTASGIKNLLLKKEINKFGWPVSYAVLRVSEIIALAKYLTCDEGMIRDRLAEHESAVTRDMYGSKDFQEMLNKFLKAI